MQREDVGDKDGFKSIERDDDRPDEEQTMICVFVC